MAASGSSCASTPEVGKRGRKRLRVESEWQKKKRKLLKDSGEVYATYAGAQKPAKEMLSPSCKCKYRCCELAEEECERLFTDFYKLGNHDSQNKYLFGLLRREPIKRKRRGTVSRRSHTISYHVRLKDGSQVQVCKRSFCDLHAIGKRRIEKLTEKLVAGVLVPGDARGKHSNRPHSIPEERKDLVREHIRSMPRQKSHYSRNSNRRKEYLSEGLSIARMHQMYLEKYEPQAKALGTEPKVCYYVHSSPHPHPPFYSLTSLSSPLFFSTSPICIAFPYPPLTHVYCVYV